MKIDDSYMLGNISKNLFQYTYRIPDDRIELLPILKFSKELDGLEKISNKEFRLHINTGTNTLILLPGSKLAIKPSFEDVVIESMKIVSPSLSIQYIPLIKYEKNNTSVKYMITEYYKLLSEQYIEIKTTDETKSNEIEFIFADLLRII